MYGLLTLTGRLLSSCELFRVAFELKERRLGPDFAFVVSRRRCLRLGIRRDMVAFDCKFVSCSGAWFWFPLACTKRCAFYRVAGLSYAPASVGDPMFTESCREASLLASIEV